MYYSSVYHSDRVQAIDSNPIFSDKDSTQMESFLCLYKENKTNITLDHVIYSKVATFKDGLDVLIAVDTTSATILEVDGNISVLTDNFNKRSKKKAKQSE